MATAPLPGPERPILARRRLRPADTAFAALLVLALGFALLCLGVLLWQVMSAGLGRLSVEFLQNYDIIIHPRCKALYHEFSHYSYDIDERTGAVIPKLLDKDNHGIDAARYATEPLRKPRAFTLKRSEIERL